jgi:hypothetical protein
MKLENIRPRIIFEQNQCFKCKFYTGKGRCLAFPDEIPDEVFSGDFIHNKKHPKQKNIVLFEKI